MSQPASADAVFAHLQELLEELPHMQELGERARLAHAVQQACRLRHELESARAVLQQCSAELARARAQMDEASAAGDEQAHGRFRREVLFQADQVALAKGPVNDAKFRLANLLEGEGLSGTGRLRDDRGEALCAEELAEAVERAQREHGLDADALTALDAQITAYQDDYNRTYEACRDLAEDLRG